MSVTSQGRPAVFAVWGAATDRGRRRSLNEDSFLAAAPVFVVADGMGGHEAGEVASAMTVDALRDLVGSENVTPDDVQRSLADAHRRVTAIAHSPGRGAGTTVSGVVLCQQDGVPYWLVLNVGDSRTYRLAGGVLEQVSVDHSEIQEMLDAGKVTRAEAAVHPRRHVVTRAIGAGPGADADYWLIPVAPHDRILVCSDGLTGEVDDVVVTDILLTETDPQRAATRLVDEALAAGGRDNVTVLVVDVRDIDGVEDDPSQTAPRPEAGLDDEDTMPRGRTTTVADAEPAEGQG